MTQMPATPDEPLAHAAAERPGELLDRFLARLVDGVLLGVVYALLSQVIGSMLLTGFIYSRGELFVYYLVTLVLFTAISIGYFAFLESSRGQTVGKMLLKLKTVGPDGGNPNMEQAIRRNIMYAASLIGIVPVVGLWLGPLVSLAVVVLIAVGINNDAVKRQGWHDKFAGGTEVRKIG
ncbi:MAG: RDD family protein [Nocardioides sp.]